MKRLVIFALCQLLVFISPFSSALAQESPPDSVRVPKSYEEGLKDGTDYAHNYYSSQKWFWGGFAGGFLLYGPVGTGVVAGVSQLGTARLPMDEQFRIQDESQPYQEGFQKGYSQRAQAKALGRSLIGGAAGTGTLIVVGSIAVLIMAHAFREGSNSW